MSKNPNRILLVDDEQAVLDALCRQHRKQFTLIPACGPEAGLRALEKEGPFAVVVSDQQMPGMSGVQFLSKAAELSPDTARVMLTGNADQGTAIEAVNQGKIFRFLSKPCAPEVFINCLEAGLEQHRLLIVERELLEQTLKGSIEVLAEVLALSNPRAFGRATRIQSLVRHIVQTLRLPNAWQYETAALLSQIGYVAVPEVLLDRLEAGEDLDPAEVAMLNKHTEVARQLLMKIPRLDTVAEIIYNQGANASNSKSRSVVVGGRMLEAASDFEEFLSLGATRKQALEALNKEGEKYGKTILTALASAVPPSIKSVGAKRLGISQLRIGMLIQEDVRNKGGNLIVTAGHEVTPGSLARLTNHAKIDQLKQHNFLIFMQDLDEADDTQAA